MSKKAPAQIIPPGEMRNFLEELGRITDKDSFNSLMKRFDESFMMQYNSKGSADQIKPLYSGSTKTPAVPQTSAPQYPPQYYQPEVRYQDPRVQLDPYIRDPRSFTQDPRLFTQDPRPYTQDPRTFREGGYQEHRPRPLQDPYSQYNKPIEEPNQFNPQGYIEDKYRLPMYHRGPEAQEKPLGYIRTEHVNYLPQDSQGYGQSLPGYMQNQMRDPRENLYGREKMVGSVSGYGREPQMYARDTGYSQGNMYKGSGSESANVIRNPIQESMDLRRAKEELLAMNRNEKPIEEVTLPPARYNIAASESPAYAPQNFRSFNSKF